MKRFFILMLSLLLLSACAAPPQDPEGTPAAPAAVETEPSLSALRQLLRQDGAFCGIAYLGCLPEGEALEGYLERTGALDAYPFLAALLPEQVVYHEGPEIYCIVPRTQEAVLRVQAWICNEENHYRGEPGTTLYADASGTPVLLLGNESTIIPNLFLTLEEADGERMEYNPCLSLCDGTIDLPVAPMLYDFSRYEAVR